MKVLSFVADQRHITDKEIYRHTRNGAILEYLADGLVNVFIDRERINDGYCEDVERNGINAKKVSGRI